MRWQDPKTDWTNGEQFSCEEMNRISANINYLNPKAGLKADYTEDDILTQGQWDALQGALAPLIIICGISAEVPCLFRGRNEIDLICDLLRPIATRLFQKRDCRRDCRQGAK